MSLDPEKLLLGRPRLPERPSVRMSAESRLTRGKLGTSPKKPILSVLRFKLRRPPEDHVFPAFGTDYRFFSHRSRSSFSWSVSIRQTSGSEQQTITERAARTMPQREISRDWTIPSSPQESHLKKSVLEYGVFALPPVFKYSRQASRIRRFASLSFAILSSRTFDFSRIFSICFDIAPPS